MFFDLWSVVYDNPVVQRAVYRVEHDAVMAVLPAQSKTILDVGCGTGLLTGRLATERPQATVTGFDFSAGMLDQARQQSPTQSWVRGDATRLPVRSSGIDVITCTESFHWYPDQPAAVSEFARVLRPNGRAIITFLSPPAAVLSRLAGAALNLACQPATFPTRGELRMMLRQAGLEVVSQRPIRFAASVIGPVITVAELPA
jgi:ubiquinone/menaquinone biosynthesis C-methylase UbiE